MAAITTTPASVGAHITIPRWAWFTLVLAMFGLYLVLQENALINSAWTMAHDLMHDGRHALGVPCH